MENFVSVIVPVKNASDTIDEFLTALKSQNWSGNQFEIIVVDNGSVDDTISRVEKYPVRLFFESNKSGPYSARNLGISYAKGNIIALTDANKIPEQNWIKKGVKALASNNAGLAAGKITFEISEESSSSEVYDALTYNNNKKLVEEEGAATTGNLFFYRDVYDQIDGFPENIRSGMDIWWTKKAVKCGFKLVYSEDAVVVCKPRYFKEILKKSYRVGKSHPHNLKADGVSSVSIFMMTLRTFAPPKIKPLKESILQTGLAVNLMPVWFVAWQSKIFMALGRLNGLLRKDAIKTNR
ncbi:MAG: glycosyltransferase [Balneolaceae bacterium]|nr:MAG: glycosyltransferase [Balneolaceae bacterium]